MSELEKLEAIHCAIQEALNGNKCMLFEALRYVEDIREKKLESEVRSL
jgi:hypothetical protein|tara:strand:- start:3219 stop:3362 length:144 start_codon:yes stop_codon:yes gene_type:complete